MAEVKPLRLKAQRVAKRVAIAADSPTAQICVDTGVFHLANSFDYLVPEDFSDLIRPGVFVKVQFGPNELSGYVVSRNSSDLEPSKLKPILKIISPIPLLTDELIEIIELTCERYSCKPWDVIRSAIPMRMAGVEKAFLERDLPASVKSASKHGHELTVTENKDGLSSKINEILSGLKGMEQLLVIVPDERDVFQITSANLNETPIILTSLDSKTLRYGNYLKTRFDQPRLIIGTRSAIFTPLSANSTILIFNDGDESMYERRFPTWNVRDIAMLRSSEFSLHFLSASPTLEIVRLAELGWIKAKQERSESQIRKIPIYFADSNVSDISVIKNGLKRGNVLVVMAETGYVNAMGCQKCRNQAKCSCGGKLYIPTKQSYPKCFLCDEEFKDWQCAWCNEKTIRAISKGSTRFAEEIGKAVPGTRVLISKGALRLDFLPENTENAIVISSYGCEPSGSYSAVILKSLENLTNRVELRSLEFARRVIFENMNRVSKSEGSAIHLDIQSTNPISQGLLRSDAYRLCLDEIEERKSSKLPPFTRLATLVGESSAIRSLARSLDENDLFSSISVIHNSQEKGTANQSAKLILRTEIARSEEFSEFFRDLSRYRGIKALSPLQLRMDPFSI
ncbi:unannotated protein [freshwater metagenome]|uniref:Unannotated protein n=1 Tax=freshwater metagenome TaxID=449393 RepID=A0A6J6TCI9_9ZZZZ|nr:hypothetical protein [Actinomycetota bacterium]